VVALNGALRLPIPPLTMPATPSRGPTPHHQRSAHNHRKQHFPWWMVRRSADQRRRRLKATGLGGSAASPRTMRMAGTTILLKHGPGHTRSVTEQQDIMNNKTKPHAGDAHMHSSERHRNPTVERTNAGTHVPARNTPARVLAPSSSFTQQVIDTLRIEYDMGRSR
jgi:hypothetical protein